MRRRKRGAEYNYSVDKKFRYLYTDLQLEPNAGARAMSQQLKIPKYKMQALQVFLELQQIIPLLPTTNVRSQGDTSRNIIFALSLRGRENEFEQGLPR